MDYIDIDLLLKYDKPGPRYTSYPPVPVFTKEFTESDFKEAIIENNLSEKESDLSLYFHIPFCDTLCYFCGCNMVVSRDQNRMKEYILKILEEVRMVKSYLSARRKVIQLHWGGGTPSNLSPDNIRLLADNVNSLFDFAEDAEISVEIDPRGLTREHMKAFKEAHFNRISMGVQDFNPEIQTLINRIQSEEITKAAIDWSRELGFKSINIDLIYGLPLQSAASFIDTLDKIIEFSPERIAVFNFAYVPWLKPHQKIIKKEYLPSSREKLNILKATIERLTAAGYVYIGMDHFAKSYDELAKAQKEKTLYRNFQGYSTRAGADLYAFGITAISQFNFIYSQNLKRIREYYQSLEKGKFPVYCGYKMNNDDIIRRNVIMRLMCDMELDKKEIENKYKIKFDEYFQDSLNKLEEPIKDGLVKVFEDKIIVSSIGRLLIRNIAMCFDAYLDRLSREKPIFSRTV